MAGGHGRVWTAALALLLGLAFAWGCAGAPARHRRRHVVPVPARLIVLSARSQLGAPYAYGGDDPSTGFDCSGLVWWCWMRHGSRLPRTAQGQYRVGVPVARRDLRAGDLVFFVTASGPDQPSHVGIMINHDWFIHSPASGEYVREDELSNNFWRRSYYGARRIE